MLKRLASRRPSHATVVAYLALFVALGGSAIAATRITSKQIVNNTITSTDIKNKTIKGKDVARNTLTGTQISESKLGVVPSAKNAASAANANTVGGRSAADLTLHCPSGTDPFAGVCFEKTARANQGLEAAMRTCGNAGRRLPTPGELVAYANKPGVTLGVGEQTDNIYENGSTRQAFIVSGPSSNGFSTAVTTPRPFRCLAYPSN